VAVRTKSVLPEELEGLEYQEYPNLLPRQNEAYGRLLQARPGSYTLLGYGGAMGGGKGCNVAEHILTLKGMSTMGELEVGDFVFAPDGTPTEVLGVSDVHYRPCFKITFSDGQEIIADDEHRWAVWTWADRSNYSRRTPEARAHRRATRVPTGARGNRTAAQSAAISTRNSEWAKADDVPRPVRVVDTLELRELVRLAPQSGRVAVETARPLDLPSVELPIDPYVLGVWLGDGNSHDGGFCGADDDVAHIIPHIEAAGFVVRKRPSQAIAYGILELAALLRALGLKQNKHIPQDYILSSQKQRLALLQGLMDTDGYAAADGKCEFTTTSPALRDGAALLIRSLGWRVSAREGEAKLNGRVTGPKWRLVFTPTEPVFRLPRKAARQRFGGNRSKWRYILSVEPTITVPTKCIQVAHPSGCYLVGEHLGITHNSIFLSTICNQFALAFPGTRILLCRDTLKALKDSTLIDFMSMLPRQLILKYNHSENWVRIRRETWPKGVYSQVNFMGVHDYEAIGSAAYQIILLDEAHEIPAAAARFLLTRLRWQLPKSVKQAMATQCRNVSRGNDGEWVLCGARCPEGSCELHGPEWVSDQVPYYFVATANPWPGWYAEWFAKGEMAEGLEALGPDSDVSVHFVQSLMRDNVYLPRNYEALASAGLTPEERRRFIDGEFGVFTGMVYEMFDRRVHAWKQPEIPMYNRVIGGLDFGNESSTGHYTTGVVLLVTPSGRLMMVDEFKRRGPKVYEQQGLWMQKMQEKWGKPIGKKIEWRGDKAQGLGIKMMADLGFNITKSNKPGMDRIDVGIRHCAGLLNHEPGSYPGFFYLPEGHPQGGCPQFEKEMMEYRRDPETLKVVKESDDMVDAFRYACELIQSISGDPAKLFKNSLPQMDAA
jgi:phage terminase large subunit